MLSRKTVCKENVGESVRPRRRSYVEGSNKFTITHSELPSQCCLLHIDDCNIDNTSSNDDDHIAAPWQAVTVS